VRNLSPGCFFLADSGSCEVHNEHGYSAKPETCRLFPFNGMLRYGQYLIVHPHNQLCPLQVVRYKETLSSASRYSALLDAMREQGVAVQIRHVTATSLAAERRIACEREIVSCSEEWLHRADYLGFAEAQLKIEMGAGLIANVDAQATIRGTILFASQLLGTPVQAASGGHGRLEETMVAVTPYLRALTLFHEDSEQVVEKGLLQISACSLPAALSTLYMLAEAARISGARDITFQTLNALRSEFLPVITLVACRDMVTTWRRGAPLSLSSLGSAGLQPAFVRLARALLPANQRKEQRSLGSLLLEHAPSDAIQRSVFLKELGRKLLGKLVALEHEPSGQGRAGVRHRVLGTMERWALAKYDDAKINVLYERKRNEHPHS
jgi:hypothetical protein